MLGVCLWGCGLPCEGFVSPCWSDSCIREHIFWQHGCVKAQEGGEFGCVQAPCLCLVSRRIMWDRAFLNNLVEGLVAAALGDQATIFQHIFNLFLRHLVVAGESIELRL
uniref:Uncharacterized protein n=1 Tax=Physcomitrium patens TaxID=3218 RepID=A0A2K1IDE2_PHYPA|nr:hypothetical protein PHYPA_029447 [Physcomitrium patens]